MKNSRKMQQYLTVEALWSFQFPDFRCTLPGLDPSNAFAVLHTAQHQTWPCRASSDQKLEVDLSPPQEDAPTGFKTNVVSIDATVISELVGRSSALNPGRNQRKPEQCRTGNSRRVDVRSGGPPAPSPRSPQVPLACPDSSTEETWWPGMDGQADRCLARGFEYSRRDGNRTPLHPNICQSRDPRAAEKRSSCRVRRSRKNHRASECQEPSLKQKSCIEGFFLEA